MNIQSHFTRDLTPAGPPRDSSCRVLFVYPKFLRPSFWNLGAVCELLNKRRPAAPLSLITVAALLPSSWEMRLIDRNVETLTDEDLEWADLVMTTGMLPQQPDTLDVIRMAQAKGKPVAVGGPDATSSPEIYAEADFRVLGEAELIINDFVAAWNSGQRSGLFIAEKFKADVSTSPIPRFDLLTFKHYMFVGVQYSRGCPFTCEFCDIIELYGRVPRYKTNKQMLAELDRLYELGYRGHVDFVDDNFIGNKKAIKLFLPDLIAWQQARKFPFQFSTEASVNLADDEPLMAMMREANFFAVFVGIESPDAATLNAMKKKQNTRRSLEESIRKIYANGMFVFAGFILGFDSEEGSISEGMVLCIEQTSIPVCMIGLLYALPNTQLTRRLTKEGRLYAGHDLGEMTRTGGDQCTEGLNFETRRPRREILADFAEVLERVYAPANYFARVREVGRCLQMAKRGGPPPSEVIEQAPEVIEQAPEVIDPVRAPANDFARARKGRRHLRRASLGIPSLSSKDISRLVKTLWRMFLKQPRMMPYVFINLRDCLVRNPAALESVMTMMAMYLHLGPFARWLLVQVRAQIAEIDSGAWVAPPRVPASEVIRSVALGEPEPMLTAAE